MKHFLVSLFLSLLANAVESHQQESDLLVPMPVDYHKEVEDEEEEPQQQFETESSDTLIEPLSEDTWKGIVPTPRPLVPPSEEVSSVFW